MGVGCIANMKLQQMMKTRRAGNEAFGFLKIILLMYKYITLV